MGRRRGEGEERQRRTCKELTIYILRHCRYPCLSASAAAPVGAAAVAAAVAEEAVRLGASLYSIFSVPDRPERCRSIQNRFTRPDVARLLSLWGHGLHDSSIAICTCSVLSETPRLNCLSIFLPSQMKGREGETKKHRALPPGSRAKQARGHGVGKEFVCWTG